jgi:catechol 2,3-dioxygenase-like lactoylglutathione lyase family enzyme
MLHPLGRTEACNHVLRKIDRILLRVPSLQAAVRYYTQTLGLQLLKQDHRLASLKFTDSDTELILHIDPDLPAEATYYRVDDVRDFYTRRAELKMTFVSPPSQASRGWRATVKDPFGNVLLIIDRTADQTGLANAVVEDAKPAGSLFAGAELRSEPDRSALIAGYTQIGRTADDLPYTPHFETLYRMYIDQMPDPKPTRAETWRHLLNLRKKKGLLPKLGKARSLPPEISATDRARLLEMLGEDIGKRDRLPYTDRFDRLVDHFNKTQSRPISPHMVWRLVATLAK